MGSRRTLQTENGPKQIMTVNEKKIVEYVNRVTTEPGLISGDVFSDAAKATGVSRSAVTEMLDRPVVQEALSRVFGFDSDELHNEMCRQSWQIIRGEHPIFQEPKYKAMAWKAVFSAWAAARLGQKQTISIEEQFRGKTAEELSWYASTGTWPTAEDLKKKDTVQ